MGEHYQDYLAAMESVCAERVVGPGATGTRPGETRDRRSPAARLLDDEASPERGRAVTRKVDRVGMTSYRPEGNWVGDETDHLTGYAESWRLDDLDDLDDEDDEDDWTREPT